MSQSPYIPENGSVVDVFYQHNTHLRRVQDVADLVGCSPQTITKWDREGVFPHWALERLGFVVTYGEPETPISKLIELRDELNAILEKEHDEFAE